MGPIRLMFSRPIESHRSYRSHPLAAPTARQTGPRGNALNVPPPSSFPAHSSLSIGPPYQRIIEPTPTLVLLPLRKRTQTNHVLGQKQSAYRSSLHLHRRRRLVGPRSNGGSGGVGRVPGTRIQFNSGLSRLDSHCQRCLSDRRSNDAIDQWFRTASAADRQTLSNSNYFHHCLRR
jgi:hypothetical protein